MNEPFTQNIETSLYDTDMNAKISIQNIVKYFMEAAVDHSEHTEYKLDRLLAARRGWVVLNWVIKMKEYPGFADKLKISTWAKPGCSLQATRYFTMEYEDGTTAAEAVSRWAFLDLETRHPIRCPLEMMEAYCYDREEPFNPGKFNLPKEKEENIISERKITVRRSETDTNGHTNNARYVEWAVDDVPDDVYTNYKAEEIRVLYRKECRAGEAVTIKTYLRDDENGLKEIITSMENDNGDVLCKLSTIWSKK